MTIDQKDLQDLIEKSLRYPALSPDLSLDVQKLQATIKQADLTVTLGEANSTLAASFTLTYGSNTYSPDRSRVGQWLIFSKQDAGGSPKFVVQVDESKIRDYVAEVASNIDRPMISKKITVRNNVSGVTREGQDGLSVDQDAAVAAIMGAANSRQNLSYQLAVKTIAFTTATVYINDVAGCSNLDGSTTYIEVNISTQHMCVWDNGSVVYESPLTSGASRAGFGTPAGLYAIYAKTTNFWMDGHPLGYDYLVHVDYWMPFYGNYGLHDSCNSVSCWRSSFGGQDYTYNGSHGCVNLPHETAAFLYDWSHIGTPVWVHY